MNEMHRPPAASASVEAQAARSAVEANWLLQIAQRGAAEPRAFRELTESYGPKILTFCVRRGLSVAEAEDLLQDVFTTLYLKAGEYREGTNPSPWIWSIARHRWVDVLRDPYRSRRQAGNDEADDGGIAELAEQQRAPASELPPQAADACVQQGLQRFARGHAEEAMVVYLRDLEGWAIADVAQYLGRTEGATRTFLSEVRKKLKPYLEDCLALLCE